MMISAILLAAAVQSTGLPPQDKLLHATGAATLEAVCEHLAEEAGLDATDRTVVCLVSVNGLGIIKEVTDPLRGGQKELGDVLANGLGSGGMSLMLKIRW